jgi:hypothetical protein
MEVSISSDTVSRSGVMLRDKLDTVSEEETKLAARSGGVARHGVRNAVRTLCQEPEPLEPWR